MPRPPKNPGKGEGEKWQWVDCPTCRGSGSHRGQVCPLCMGKGKIWALK